MVRLTQNITKHPDAVFIARTAIEDRDDESSKLDAGKEIIKQVIVPQESNVSQSITFKPNLTGATGTISSKDLHGMITDQSFSSGVIAGLKDMGVNPCDIYIREANWLKEGYFPHMVHSSPYMALSETGVNLLSFSSGREITEITYDTLKDEEVVWHDIPDGVVFNRIGYLSPFAGDGTFLLNISKLKAHGMGMSLCCKNLQGTCMYPYVRFCEPLSKLLSYKEPYSLDIKSDLETKIQAEWARHDSEAYPRWDRPGSGFDSGTGMELWCQKTCDNLSGIGIVPGLHMIEGIYARNGDGFTKGPGPGGCVEEFMTNVLIFGMNPVAVDMVGCWIGGHDPSAFGFFRIANERGLYKTYKIEEMPLYAWNQGAPERISASDLQRTELLTTYMRRDYGGKQENVYHLIQGEANV